jgi:hypothetical protein
MNASAAREYAGERKRRRDYYDYRGPHPSGTSRVPLASVRHALLFLQYLLSRRPRSRPRSLL